MNFMPRDTAFSVTSGFIKDGCMLVGVNISLSYNADQVPSMNAMQAMLVTMTQGLLTTTASYLLACQTDFLVTCAPHVCRWTTGTVLSWTMLPWTRHFAMACAVSITTPS